MDAILYTSNTGSTQRYAALLSQATGLPAFPLVQADQSLSPGAEVLYLGWVRAGQVQGYPAAAKKYRVRAVCAVAMARTGTQTDVIRGKSAIPGGIPLFTLQGNFDLKKLRGLYRLMMTIMVKTAGKKLAAKADRTPDEADMLDMMFHGAHRVREENLAAVLAWYQSLSQALSAQKTPPAGGFIFLQRAAFLSI